MAHKTSTKLDPEKIPRHVAVIMDGNGRWARKQKLPRLQGHYQGYRTLKEIVIAAADLNIEVLTAYAFSSENWRRPKSEVSGLMKLIHHALEAELRMMKEKGVRIIISGRVHELPELVRKQFEEDIEATKHNSRIILNIALNYGGRNEIVDAAKQAAKMAVEGKISPEEVDEKLLSSLMYHPELPDPDLLIRTAGEMRISNFLLWEAAYTEIYMTDTLWPDFCKDDLVRAMLSFQRRTRRFGKVVES